MQLVCGICMKKVDAEEGASCRTEVGVNVTALGQYIACFKKTPLNN